MVGVGDGGLHLVRVTSLGLASAISIILALASSAQANGVTFPIAAGTSGPYTYEVGVGPFSPDRTYLFVAVTLMAGDSPVTDADVLVTASVDGLMEGVGPLEAINSLDHPPTYEVTLHLPRLATESVNLAIEVDGRKGRAKIGARMMIPDSAGPIDPPGGSADAGGERSAAQANPNDRRGAEASFALPLAVAAAVGATSLAIASWLFVRGRSRRR